MNVEQNNSPQSQPVVGYTQNELNTASAESTSETSVNSSEKVVQWQASEFIDHEKSFSWYTLLMFGAIIGCGLMFLITKSIFSSVIILLSAVALAFVAHQKPRILNYTLTPNALIIAGKSYMFDDFRAFSVVSEGALTSIVLQPIKRFLPVLTIYFPLDEAEKIFDVIASHIPHEEYKPDPVDRMMNRIRF